MDIKPAQIRGMEGDFPIWDKKVIKWDSGWFSPGGNEDGYHVFNHWGSEAAGNTPPWQGNRWEPDIVCLWARGKSVIGDPVFVMQWDMSGYTYGQRIIGIDSTKIVTHGVYNYVLWTGSDFQKVSAYTSAYKCRLLAMEKTPDYESAWIAGGAAGSQKIIHCEGLSRTPDFYTLEQCLNIKGEDDRGYAMSGLLNYSGNYPNTICDVDGTNIIMSQGNSQSHEYYDLNNTAKTAVDPLKWYFKAKAWVWPADYDSGWTACSTTNRVHVFEHALGEIPFLYLLEFSRGATGTPDRVPLMSSGVYNVDPYAESSHLHQLGERYATVLLGDGIMARYEDRGGTLRGPTSGYIRLKLWAQ